MDSAPALEPRPGRAVRVVAALAVAASAAYFWGTNLADEDLWNHLNFGELKLRTLGVPRFDAWSYSAPGHAWFNHEWGAEVVFALIYRVAGAPGLFALKIAAGFALLAAMLDAARTLERENASGGRAHPVLTAAVLLVAFAALAPGASFRPQLFTMMFLGFEWCLLLRTDAWLFASVRARRTDWALGLVPLVVLVWTNMHGGFPVGVALHGIFVIGVLLRALAARAWGDPAPSHTSLCLVMASGAATLVATLVNPYGPALHRYLATTLAGHEHITEWQPLPLLDLMHLPFEVLALATLACAVPWLAAHPRRSAWIDWRLAFVVLALVSALKHQRHSVLFVIVATPLLVAAGEHVRRRLLARWPALAPRRPVLATIAAGVLAVAGIQVATVTTRHAESGLAIRYAREEFPADAVAFLRAHGIRGNMAVQFEWGGYTLFHLRDAARVFLDGRYEATYPPEVIDDYFAFIEARAGWNRVLDAYPTDVVMVERSALVTVVLDRRPDLVRVYADSTAVVYVRRTATNADALAALTAVAARPPTSLRPTYFP